jgi:hypothetical protein
VRFVATIARRWTGDGYTDIGGLAVSETGSLTAVALGVGNDDWAAQTQEAADEGVGSFADPEAFLHHLWDRNSTVTAYSKPTVLVAKTPTDAVQKLAARQETA